MLQEVIDIANAEDHWQEAGPEGWTQITTGDLKQQGVGNKDVNVTHFPFSPVDVSL